MARRGAKVSSPKSRQVSNYKRNRFLKEGLTGCAALVSGTVSFLIVSGIHISPWLALAWVAMIAPVLWFGRQWDDEELKELAFFKAHQRHADSFDDWQMVHREEFSIVPEDPYTSNLCAKQIAVAVLIGAVLALSMRFGCSGSMVPAGMRDWAGR